MRIQLFNIVHILCSFREVQYFNSLSNNVVNSEICAQDE